MAKMNKRDIEKQLQGKNIPMGHPDNTPEVPAKPAEAPIPMSTFPVPEAKPEPKKPDVVPFVKAASPEMPASKKETVVIAPEKKPEIVKTDFVAPKIEELKAPPKKMFESEYFKKMTCNYNSKGEWQKQYAKWLENWLKINGKMVLDLGCAMGAISSAMADIGAKVVGVDISEHAKKTSSFKNFEHLTADVRSMNTLKDGSFDRIHAMSVFECLEQSQFGMVLEEIERLLAKSGLAFIVASKNDIAALAECVKVMKFKGEIVTEKMIPEMRKHFDGWNFLGKYNWGVLVLERK